MGTWNTSIMGNDTSAEVYEYFKRMYKYQEGNKFKWTVEEIVDSLYTYYYDTIRDLPSEKSAFFFVLAHALWEVDALTPKIKSIVKELIDKRIDYNAWKELEADDKTLKKRLAATEEFYQKLLTKKPKPKKRELLPKNLSPLVVGDCIAFKHKGKYYGLVTTNDARNVGDGTNDFLFVDIEKQTLPTLDDFYNAKFVLNEDLINHLSGTVSNGTTSAVLFTVRFSKIAVEKAMKQFVYVGKLPFIRTYFERSAERVTTYSGKVGALDKFVTTAIDLWLNNPWTVSTYTVASDAKVPTYTIFKKIIEVGKLQIPIKDLYVKIDNSLWHVNVWFFVKGIPVNKLDDIWLVLVDLINQKIGREINGFYLLDEKHVDINTLIPFVDIDAEKYTMKHV